MENIAGVLILMFAWWLGSGFGRIKEQEKKTIAEIFPPETRVYITEKGKSWRLEKN